MLLASVGFETKYYARLLINSATGEVASSYVIKETNFWLHIRATFIQDQDTAYAMLAPPIDGVNINVMIASVSFGSSPSVTYQKVDPPYSGELLRGPMISPTRFFYVSRARTSFAKDSSAGTITIPGAI